MTIDIFNIEICWAEKEKEGGSLYRNEITYLIKIENSMRQIVHTTNKRNFLKQTVISLMITFICVLKGSVYQFLDILRIGLPCPIHPPGTCVPQVKSCWALTCRCMSRSRLPRAVTLSKAVSILAAISREPRRRAPARKQEANRRHM